MRKLTFEPGMICSVDPKNKLKQDTNSIATVELLEKIPEKSSIFETWWKVRTVDHVEDCRSMPEEAECPESILYPGGMVIIRLPPDLPTINQIDIDLMNLVINMAKQSGKFDEAAIKRIAALKEKLELCKRLREV